MREGPHDGISNLIRQQFVYSLPCEKTVRRTKPPKPGTESAGTFILDFQLIELWKIIVYCLSHPLCGIL